MKSFFSYREGGHDGRLGVLIDEKIAGNVMLI